MATRDLSSDVASAVSEKVKHVLAFVQLDFGSESVFVTNAAHDVEWNGQTWRGVGKLGQVDVVEESVGVAARALKFTISGVDNAHLSYAMEEDFRNRPAKLWLGLVQPGQGVLADPVLIFVGRMSEMSIRRGGQSSAISVVAESAMAVWARPNTRRFSDADQQAEFPGDLGLQYIAELASGRELVWGRT